MTSNEMRSKIGLEPSKDPKADQLVNSNLNQPEEKKETDPAIEDIVHAILLYHKNSKSISFSENKSKQED